MNLGRGCGLLLVLATAVAPARAEPAKSGEPSSGKRAAAVTTAAVPGLIVHGAGHYLLGERRTARRLLLVQGVGLGAAAVGGVVVGFSGAARDLSGPAIPLLIGGAGLLLVGWLADIYGTAGGAGGQPRARLADAEVELGYAFVHDPQFDYRSFAVARGAVGWRGFELRPSVWVATGDDNQRWRGEVAYRLAGPRRCRSCRAAADGTGLELGGAVTFHEHGSEQFEVLGGELFVAGRLDLHHVGPTLRGAFTGAHLGVGDERIAYDLGAVDWNSQLLGGFEFGIYLGAGAGEVAVGYDHRRDDYAGGLATARGGGFLGHFALRGQHRLTGDWGVGWELERGAANIARVGLVRSIGGPR